MDKRKEKIIRILTRVIILSVLFFLWHLTQDAISNLKSEMVNVNGLVDQTFSATHGINAYLNSHREVARLLLIFASLEVDLLTLYIFGISIFGKSTRPVVGLVVLMVLRQFCQCMVLLPVPEGLLWFDTGFPTLFVTYDVTNDFFFSGHTALTVYAALALCPRSNTVKMHIIRWGLIIFQIGVLVALRAHYFMDIYTAFFTALAVHCFIKRIPLPGWLELRSDDEGS